MLSCLLCLFVACASAPPQPSDGGIDAGVDGGERACAFTEVSSTLVPVGTAPNCTAASYSATRDVAYAAGRPEFVLDVYRPNAGVSPSPTVIWVHGGGWMSGSKTQVNQALWLVCQGYAVVSVEYRLSDVAPFPAQVHDVKAAVRFLRANAATWGLDPARFALFGSSAGGHLAALAGTSDGVPSLEDLSQGNESVSSRVKAIVDWYGPALFSTMDAQLIAQGCAPGTAHHGDIDSGESKLLGCAVSDASCEAKVSQASLLTHVDADDPPMIIFNGDSDCVVAAAQSRSFHDAVQSAGGCASLHIVTGAEHGGPEWTTAAVRQAVSTFLSQVL